MGERKAAAEQKEEGLIKDEKRQKEQEVEEEKTRQEGWKRGQNRMNTGPTGSHVTTLASFLLPPLPPDCD